MTITTAPQIHYKPRNTTYRVLHHDVKIKQPDGVLSKVLVKLRLIPKPSSWKLGCVYICPNGNIYTRPYDMFDDRWEILSEIK